VTSTAQTDERPGRPPGVGADEAPAPGLARRALSSDLTGILGPVIFVAVAMAAAFPGFSSAFNVDALLATIAVTGLVGLAQLSVLAVGQFNLALPAMGAMTGMVVAWLLQVGQLQWPLAVALALGLAALLGLAQGALIVAMRLNPFIVTLGMASTLYGLMYVVLGNERYQKIGEALPSIGRGAVGTVPNIFLISMVVCAVVWVVMQRSVAGRQVLATGANPVAARFSALPVSRALLSAHTLSGLLAGTAAVLLVSRLAVGSPAIGQDWLLASFAAPVLGGTLLAGGKVSVVGTVLGAALLAMIANALVIVGVSQYWYQAGLGLIILGAVALDRLRLRLAASRP